MKDRESFIDLLRSIAIIIMIIANASSFLDPIYYSKTYRLFCSLAAPLFLLISGYSFSLSYEKSRSISNKIQSSLYLLITAMFVDSVLWGILPFQNFDILYVLSLGILFNSILSKYSDTVKLLTVIVIGISTVFIQVFSNYRHEVISVDIASFSIDNLAFYSENLIRSLYIDGWFPIFPWLALPIIGSLVRNWMQRLNTPKIRILFYVLTFVTILLTIFHYSSFHVERLGYVELFYPPSICIVFAGVIFSISSLIFLSNSTFLNTNKSLFLLFGKNSLQAYISHIVLIKIIQIYLQSSFPLNIFGFMVIILLIICFCFIILYTTQQVHKSRIYNYISTIILRILGIHG
jgi:uncharacterized membrane protein